MYLRLRVILDLDDCGATLGFAIHSYPGTDLMDRPLNRESLKVLYLIFHYNLVVTAWYMRFTLLNEFIYR